MRTELRGWRRAWPRVGKATVDVEVEAEVVEEEEDAEEEKEEEEGGGEEQPTLIKSNNPHLAGEELESCWEKLRHHLEQELIPRSAPLVLERGNRYQLYFN